MFRRGMEADDGGGGGGGGAETVDDGSSSYAWMYSWADPRTFR